MKETNVSDKYRNLDHLLPKLRELDESALTEVFVQYSFAIYKYARKNRLEEVDCEDVVSMTFTKLISELHKGRGPNSNIKSYLFQMARNLVVDHYRSEKGRDAWVEILDEHKSPPSDASPRAEVEAKDMKNKIVSSMNSLTEDQRKVMELRFFGELSLKETGEAMNKQPNNIKILQNRAVNGLKKSLKDMGAEW